MHSAVHGYPQEHEREYEHWLFVALQIAASVLHVTKRAFSRGCAVYTCHCFVAMNSARRIGFGCPVAFWLLLGLLLYVSPRPCLVYFETSSALKIIKGNPFSIMYQVPGTR